MSTAHTSWFSDVSPKTVTSSCSSDVASNWLFSRALDVTQQRQFSETVWVAPSCSPPCTRWESPLTEITDARWRKASSCLQALRRIQRGTSRCHVVVCLCAAGADEECSPVNSLKLNLRSWLFRFVLIILQLGRRGFREISLKDYFLSRRIQVRDTENTSSVPQWVSSLYFQKLVCERETNTNKDTLWLRLFTIIQIVLAAFLVDTQVKKDCNLNTS